MKLLRIYALSVLTALIFAPYQQLPADWPQWRGVHRDGVITDVKPPAEWPKQLQQQWQVAVGEGHSSPIVVDSRVFVMTREGDDEVVRCLELASGSEVWRKQYTSTPELNPAVGKFVSSPRATPAAAEGRVFTLGAGGVLSAFKVDNGDLVWRYDPKDAVAEFPNQFAEFGSSASPMILKDICVALIGGKDKGALVAFDGASGKIRWQLDCEGPAYSSPVLLNVGGVEQIVVQTQSNVLGVSLAGDRLWSLPFETAYRQNVVTATAHDDCVIFSGFREPLAAWRIADNKPSLAWENDKHSMYMSSPVLHGDFLFGMSERQAGHIYCVDARDGRTLWTSPGRRGENVSLQLLSDLLVLLNDKGTLIVARASADKYDVIAEYKLVDGGTYAHPVFVDGHVLIKDQENLTSYALPQ
jgi:outer membrane protein assembly factor BamB